MGLFDRIIKRLQVSKSNAELAKIDKEIEAQKLKIQKLRNDPEYVKMKKEYNLQDVPGIDIPAEEVDLDDFFKTTQKQIKKIRGIVDEDEEKKRLQRNENARKKRLRAKKSRRKKKLIEKFGKELGTRISKDKLWIGMSEEILKEMKGNPKEKKESVSRQKIRKEYFYDSYKNRQGNISYKLKVVLINGEVEKWTSN